MCQHSAGVASKQITIPRIAGAEIHYRAPQPNSWMGLSPPPAPGSRATGYSTKSDVIKTNENYIFSGREQFNLIKVWLKLLNGK